MGGLTAVLLSKLKFSAAGAKGKRAPSREVQAYTLLMYTLRICPVLHGGGGYTLAVARAARLLCSHAQNAHAPRRDEEDCDQGD